jgi:hypothetical protein
MATHGWRRVLNAEADNLGLDNSDKFWTVALSDIARHQMVLDSIGGVDADRTRDLLNAIDHIWSEPAQRRPLYPVLLS